MAKSKNNKKAVSTKKQSTKKAANTKMPCIWSFYSFDFDGSPLSPRITRYLGILPNSKKIIPAASTSLGITISSPTPGAPVSNPVKPSGSVSHDGSATVTAWLTDVSGHVTKGTVDYSHPPIWKATFPNVTAGTYFLSAQAQEDNETACQTIQIIVVH